MADYQRLLTKKALFVAIFEQELSLAKTVLPTKNAAAINIQRVFRGVSARTKISKKSFACQEIQRVFRGTMGRERARNAQRAKQQNRRASFLQYMCVQLQRCFRGYYSRKYKHDQHRRKLYCRMLVERGEEITEKMRQYSLQQAEREEEEARQKRREEFEALARNLHHLTSTKHIKGIYSPVPHLVQQPTMNQIPVEEHIRGVVKDLLRTRGLGTKSLVPDIHGTLKVPLKGLKYRLSIQATSHYDAIRDAERHARLTHKYASMNARNFFAGGKTSIIDNEDLPMAVGEPYLDPWANPLLVKGVPRDQHQLLESARLQKPLFAAPPAKPFVSRTGGNRSTTIANDLFDVIADAQETGGAVQRHLGTGTARFGLPASCDSRSLAVDTTLNLTHTKLDSSAALPLPLRTSSTLRSTIAKNKMSEVRFKMKPSKTAEVTTGGPAGAIMARMASGIKLAEDSEPSSDEEGWVPPPPRAARTLA